MKHIKRFEIDVEAGIGEKDTEIVPFQIEDLKTLYADAKEGYNVAEITVFIGSNVRILLDLENIEALFEALTHIKEKVLASNAEEEIKENV